MSEARIWRVAERDRAKRRVLHGNHESPHSDGHGSRKSALVLTGGTGSVHVALVSLLHCERPRVRSAVR
jgi:hypothetical protein